MTEEMLTSVQVPRDLLVLASHAEGGTQVITSDVVYALLDKRKNYRGRYYISTLWMQQLLELYMEVGRWLGRHE